VYVAKINIFFDIFYFRDNNNSLVIIIRVKELYFSNILSIRIDIFYSFCKIKRINKIDKIDRTRYCIVLLIRFCKAFYCCLKKSIFYQKILDIIIDNNIDTDLLREFRLVEELLVEKFLC